VWRFYVEALVRDTFGPAIAGHLGASPLDRLPHDENNNSRLDTDFIGHPTEGYALSNGIRAVIGRPRLSDAAFAVGDEDAHVTLRIKY
jgi:uncharacterized protein (DUF2141 family)